VPELLKQLVYLDALLLKNGESGFSQLDSAIVAQRIELAEKTSGGLTIPPPSLEVFGVVDPVDAEWLRRRLTPLPLNCYQVPIRLTLLARTRFTSRYQASGFGRDCRPEGRYIEYEHEGNHGSLQGLSRDAK
jgi:hypothetical protein